MGPVAFNIFYVDKDQSWVSAVEKYQVAFQINVAENLLKLTFLFNM